MIASGKMTKAGLEKIEEAKKHGLWNAAYTNLKKERLPSYLKKALMKNEKAWNNFRNFGNPSVMGGKRYLRSCSPMW
jgi:uncharacterized protein YdeI (YjbR/CyaY-like superfamily)